MDGLGRAIGDGLSGFFGGIARAVEAAVAGVVASVGSAVPVAVLVGGVLLAIVAGWLLFRR